MITRYLVGYIASFFNWLCEALHIPLVPDFIASAENFFIEAVQRGVHLFSWLFPSEVVYQGFLNLMFDCILALLLWKLVKFFLKLYDTFKL